LALTPEQSSAFLREVDDDLRRARLQTFISRWGRILLLVVGAGLLLLGAFLWWRSHREAQAGQDGERLAQALAHIDEGQASRADPLLKALSENGHDGYRAQARLAQAASAAVRNDPKAAAAAYAAIASDTSLAQPVRDLALVRQTAIEFDTLPPAQVIARMKPLAAVGNPWFGSAGELTVAAHLQLNQPKLAGPLAAAIARDPTVPVQIRGRLAGIANSLGLTVPVITPGAAAAQ
jgi:hypothetical protein